ncbi:MAG: hypothetical protein KGQ79_05325 [Proteobacteria bacterium]|nr:hypothetical protein [Pseudomonadota bacterium]
MDQHHDKAKSGYEFPIAALDPEQVIQKWQARAYRFLHAQERIAQSMAAAARAQLRYGQEFMVSRTELLHWDTAEPGHLAEHAQRDLEQLVSVVREVSAEIRTGFSDAAKMLSEEAPAEIRVSMEAASAAADKVVEAMEEEVAEAVAAAATVREAVAETTRKATRRAKSAGTDTE